MPRFKVLDDDHDGAQILVDDKPAFCVENIGNLAQWGWALFLASQAGAKEERESCAKICESVARGEIDEPDMDYAEQVCAKYIRKRKP